MDTKCGVRPRELESAPLARLSLEHSPHSLPTLAQECNKRLSSLMDGCVLQEGVDALFILLYGRYWAEHQLHAGKLVMLVFHAKAELQRPPGGAGRPPLGRLAWGCGHLATALE